MAADREDFVETMLKRIHQRFDRSDDVLREIKDRLGNIETGPALVKQELAHQFTQFASINTRLDRVDDRAGRI